MGLTDRASGLQTPSLKATLRTGASVSQGDAHVLLGALARRPVNTPELQAATPGHQGKHGRLEASVLCAMCQLVERSAGRVWVKPSQLDPQSWGPGRARTERYCGQLTFVWGTTRTSRTPCHRLALPCLRRGPRIVFTGWWSPQKPPVTELVVFSTVKDGFLAGSTMIKAKNTDRVTAFALGHPRSVALEKKPISVMSLMEFGHPEVITVTKKIENTAQPVIWLGFHSSAIEDVGHEVWLAC